MKNKTKLQLSSKKQVAFYIILITVIIAIGGYWYYGREKEQIIQQKEKTLTAIATLKAKQIEMWYRDELNDAQVISNDIQPLLENWPTESQTGESFIFNNETNNVILFNELRHQVEIETKDKIEVKNDDLLSKIYTSKQPGIYMGKDYRNVDVLASMQVIEGTNWVLISKVDKSELFQDVKRLTLQTLVWVLFIVVLSGLFIVFRFNKRQKNIYKGLLENERELWAQQEKFKVVMDSIGDGIITLDLNGNIQYLNNRAEELTGWNLREASDRDFHEVYNVINEETGQQENNILDKVLKKGLVKELGNHTILITKSGTQIPVMDTGAPLFDASGKITGIAISFQDETEKRQQRRLLVESEKRFSTTLDNMIEGCQIIGFDWRYLFINKAAELQNRRPNEELIGNKYMDMWPGIETTEVFAAAKKCMEERIPQNIDNEFTFPNGTKGWFSLNIEPIPEGIFIMSSDITDQIRAEEELLKKDQLLSSVMETQQELICRFLPDTTLTFVNKAYCNIFGRNEQELIGLKFLELAPKYEWENILSGLKNLNADNPSHTYLTSGNKPDGSVMRMEWTETAILNEQNEVIEFQAVGRDITEKLKAEQELIKAKEKAEESDKLKSAFINNISHEVRTPLNAILGFGGFLAEMDLSPEEKIEMLAHVQHSSNRLMNTMTDYMDMARIVSGTMNVSKKEFQLQPFFEEISNKTRQLCADRMIELETETPTELIDLILDSDPELIRKILNILLDNALKFTEKGSISCGYNLNNGFIKFFVQDTG
ncbi:MAG: PAS domain S-box protein, partial [Bacteroidota bacterium]|nr:PAS domain S-box protein [Bacteroidota bacterium]